MVQYEENSANLGKKSCGVLAYRVTQIASELSGKYMVTLLTIIKLKQRWLVVGLILLRRSSTREPYFLPG